MATRGANKLLFGLVCALVLLGSGAVSAQKAYSPTDTVAVEVHPSAIVWQTNLAYEGAVLTVSGPAGVTHRLRFSADDEILIQLSDDRLGPFADGQYSWELRFSPRLSRVSGDAVRKDRQVDDGPMVGRNGFERRLSDELAAVSGFFRIVSGQLVSTDRSEPASAGLGENASSDTGSSDPEDVGKAAATKQLITGDLTVHDSICAGFDCADAESFGSDTIMLKENNLRIFFDDTSSVAGYAANDWRLVANDSTSGGANYFAIEDATAATNVLVVEAGADANSLYIDDYGRVGFGTSTPVVELHTNDGNTPTLRLEQNSSQGWAAQTWDIAGNESNFFIRDATNGSKLPFRIRPGAPTSSIDISAEGNVGINTGSPSDRLHLVDGDLRVERTTAGGSDHAALYLEQSGAATTSAFVFRANATTGSLEIKDAVAAATALKFRSGAANNSIVVAPEVGGEARVGIGKTTPQGTLDVQGTIYLSGAQIHPDFVFEPGYELESIEEHAAYMWTKKHLPAMGPGQYDEDGMARFELGRHQVGLLEELEKAHIYITQLNEGLKGLQDEAVRKDASIDALRRQNQSLTERLRELERAVAALAPPASP